VRCDVRAKPKSTSIFWILSGNGTTLQNDEVIDDCWTVIRVRAARIELRSDARGSAFTVHGDHTGIGVPAPRLEPRSTRSCGGETEELAWAANESKSILRHCRNWSNPYTSEPNATVA